MFRGRLAFKRTQTLVLNKCLKHNYANNAVKTSETTTSATTIPIPPTGKVVFFIY